MPDANRSGVTTLLPRSLMRSLSDVDAESGDDRRVRNSPEHLRRDLDLRRPAADAEYDRRALHQLVVDVERQVGRQSEHGDAADHHAGERLRFVRRGERDLGGPEKRAHRVVHVEPRGGLHDARTELPWLLLRGDHDGVAGAVQREPVFLAARRRVGERRVDLHQLVRHAERVEDLNDAFFGHGRIRVMPWSASVKATVAPGASGASTAGLVTNSRPIAEAIEYSMRDPREAAWLTVPRSAPFAA